ncbi:MAG TPA: response regulator [Thermodesulfobacteriota bacterium]
MNTALAVTAPVEPPPLVLVVDDEPAICEAADVLLTDLGYRTISARSGQEGVRAAALHRPDLILLDITMPDLDGLAACKAIRSDPSTADTPVIFITARTEMAHKTAAFEMGASDYITKPFDERELSARIRALLRRRAEVRGALDEAERACRALRSELLQAGKMATLGQLLSGVAHEINNPLTAVLGYAQLIAGRADEIGDLQITRDVAKLTASAERATRIAKNLLGFARKRDPERRLVDVNAVVRAAAELEASEMRLARVEVQLDLASDLAPVLGDEQQLEQVVLNLMTNARQALAAAGRRPGRVVVRTAPCRFDDVSSGVRLAVEDDGPGIAPRDIDRIFHPFYTTKPEGQGTGLGLSLCLDVVRDHGGRIEAASTPGQGARFTVELPAAH